jgi:hypothetical protein
MGGETFALQGILAQVFRDTGLEEEDTDLKHIQASSHSHQ